MNHSRVSAMSWYLANVGSMWAKTTVWKARSHAANHGYSHGSGMDRMSAASRWRQPALRPHAALDGRGGLARVPVQPAGHVVRVVLLGPDHPGEGLPHDRRLLGRGVGRGQGGVELVGLDLPLPDDGRKGLARPAGSQDVWRVGGPQAHLEHGRLAGPDLGRVPPRRLRPLLGRVDRGRSGHHVVVDAVLREGRRGLRAEHAPVVRLVVAEHRPRRSAVRARSRLQPVRRRGWGGRRPGPGRRA